MDVDKHHHQHRHFGSFQVLRLLRLRVCRTVQHLYRRTAVEDHPSRGHFVLHFPSLELFNRHIPRQDRTNEGHCGLLRLHIVLPPTGGRPYRAGNQPLAAIPEKARIQLRQCR